MRRISNFPAALSAKILRTSLPHARIVSIDTSKARSCAACARIITGADVEGVMVGLRMKDMPLLADDKVRYVGEPVAAVAADNDEIAEEALNLIDVQYEELPFVTDPVRGDHAPARRCCTTIRCPTRMPRSATSICPMCSPTANGPTAMSTPVCKKPRAFSSIPSARRWDFTATSSRMHAPCEIHDDGRVEIWASNKAPFTLRARFARDLGLDEAKVKVHILPVGGDFGGKTSVVEAPICYFLAKKTGKAGPHGPRNTPKRLLRISHRHPAVITLRTGVDGDDKLCAMAIKRCLAAAVMRRSKPTRKSPSKDRAARRATIAFRRSKSKPCAFTPIRSPAPRRARRAARRRPSPSNRRSTSSPASSDMDPVEFRMKNLLNDGDPTPFGQKLQGIVVKETLDKALEISGWKKPKAKNIGRGVAVYERPSGAGKSGAAITIEADGSVSVHLGVPDVGPGIHTVVQQIVSEVLELPRERVDGSRARHRQLALRLRHRRQQVDQQRRHRRLSSRHRNQGKTHRSSGNEVWLHSAKRSRNRRAATTCPGKSRCHAPT